MIVGSARPKKHLAQPQAFYPHVDRKLTARISIRSRGGDMLRETPKLGEIA